MNAMSELAGNSPSGHACPSWRDQFPAGARAPGFPAEALQAQPEPLELPASDVSPAAVGQAFLDALEWFLSPTETLTVTAVSSNAGGYDFYKDAP